MGCKNAVLPKPLLINHTIKCLTYEENTRQPYNDNLCFFRAFSLHLHDTQRLEGETSKLFTFFINKMDGLSPNEFQGVHMNDNPTVEDLLFLKILVYDIDIVDGNIVGELARRTEQKYKKTLRLLRYNNHICYVNNINEVFQSFRCPNCDTFLNRTFNLERHLTIYSERVKLSIPGTYIKSEKLPLTIWTLLVKAHGWTKTFRNFINIRLWINSCPKGNRQRHMYNNLHGETCPDICINFFKHCGRTNFPLQLWSSSPRCIFYWSSWKFSFPKQNKNEKPVLWYRDNKKD